MKGYTDLFNLGHCNLITLAIKLNGFWPIKLRAYTPLNEEIDQRYDKSEYNLDLNITMGGASHSYPLKDEPRSSASTTVSLMRPR